MAAAKSKKLKMLTTTEDGKIKSQTFSNVNPAATDENMAAVIVTIGGMQTLPVTGAETIEVNPLALVGQE